MKKNTPATTEVMTSAVGSPDYQPKPPKLRPRQVRAIEALLRGPVKRERLDDIVGCSNSPALITTLRNRGLEVPCERRAGRDRDGCSCAYGVYRLSGADRAVLHGWGWST